MEITVEIDQTKIQSEVQAELLNQETSGHCSRTEENKVEELIFDEEINFQYPSSVDSDTDGSSKNPHDYGKISIFSFIDDLCSLTKFHL